jgi:hypothetical protein
MIGFYASPDLFNVVVDGQVIFSETLDELDLLDQTYQPPAGVLLTHGTNKGFNGQYPDAAYNLGIDPRFDRIPHSSSNLAIEFYASGPGWTAAYHGDESWGIDNLEALLHGTNADIDGNGTIDAADYVVWRNGLETTHTLADFHVWRANFGRALGGAAATNAAVPEPAAALLLLAAAAVMFAHPSRRDDGLCIAMTVKLRRATQIT